MDLLSGLEMPKISSEDILVTKSAFASEIGVTPGRVSQMIGEGLPVEPSGRINLARGKRWYRENTDFSRSSNTRAANGGAGIAAGGGSGRARLDAIRAEREGLRLAQERGDLVDRASVERLAFTRGRADRDAWIGWCSRAAPEIAAATGADVADVFPVLDRLIRDQLAARADTPAEDPAP